MLYVLINNVKQVEHQHVVVLQDLIIPEKEVMYEIVEAIVRFEEMAKNGERLTKAQKKQKAKLDQATRALRKVVKVNEDTRV